LTITPDGKIWGCHLFADFYKGKETTKEWPKYCFGDLASFIENNDKTFPEITSNYSNFRMDQYHTDDNHCIDCEEIEECRVCPLDNRIHGSNFKKIPRWVCEQNIIFRAAKSDFWRELIK
jgi:hypothetical protein